MPWFLVSSGLPVVENLLKSYSLYHTNQYRVSQVINVINMEILPWSCKHETKNNILIPTHLVYTEAKFETPVMHGKGPPVCYNQHWPIWFAVRQGRVVDKRGANNTDIHIFTIRYGV